MKKLLFLFLITAFISPFVLAQYDPDKEKYLKRKEGVQYPNILKINTVALPFSNISLVYERAIVPRLSINVGVGYKYAGESPRIFNSTDDLFQMQLDIIQGYSFTPEMRYYLRTCDPYQLEGFYVGLYFRHTHYETNVHFDYYRETYVESNTAFTKLNENGVGISIGYQMLLWKRFSIDFLFFGPRYSNIHVGYEFEKPASEEFLKELSDNINEIINKFGLDYEVVLKQEGESRASTSFSFVNARVGISLGFAF